MPDEYRTSVLRFVEMHANSELMGVLPEREWIMRAPTLRRKLALTAKVQDESGHAQLLYRVAEDLGKTREQMYQDLLDGKTKFHNVFHYPTKTWADVGHHRVARRCRRDRRPAGAPGVELWPVFADDEEDCWEESVHIMHGRDVVVTLMNGTARAARDGPGSTHRWSGPLMQMHGPRTDPRRIATCSGGSRRRPARNCARNSSRRTCRGSGRSAWRSRSGPALRRCGRGMALHRTRLGMSSDRW